MQNRITEAGTAAQKWFKSSLIQRPAIILAMLLLCAVFFVTGCSNIKKGKVIWIGFIPPHNEKVMQTAYGGNGVSYVWVNEYVPDTTWFIKFTDKKKEREIHVSREDANKYNIGDAIELTNN